MSEQCNVLLIALPCLVAKAEAKGSKIRSFRAFPYGLLSVATYLKNSSRKNVNINVIDCNTVDDDFMAVIDASLIDCRPDVVGISMMFDISYRHLKKISAKIKQRSENTIVVLGGASASSSYDTIIREQEHLDGICFLEGELPMLRLIEADCMLAHLEDDPSWITQSKVSANFDPEKSFVEDLSSIVHIDYALVDTKKYRMQQAFSPFVADQHDGQNQFFLVTSRGCPYKCVFCSNSSIHGNYIRYADVDDIIKHVDDLVDRYAMEVLTIYDDQLLSNKKRAKEIFRRLAKYNLRIECPNGLSVAFIDAEMAELMRAAGMDTIALAIESGSEYMIREIIHKPLRLDKIKPVVQLLRKYGFFIEGFFVIGIPGEKDEHRAETLRFIKETELDWSGFSLAIPLRGSQLYDICVENGYIDKDLKIGETDITKYIIRTPDLDPERVQKQAYQMNLDVNFVNNYRMKIGDYSVAANCFQDVIRRYEKHAFAYYYLSKAQKSMHAKEDSAEKNMNVFKSIIQQDPSWKAYAEHFHLT